MSGYTISIPDTIYEQAQLVARLTSRQVDDVIRARLEGAFKEPLIELPADEEAELQALTYLSDDALWTIAREQMQPHLQKRISELLEKNQAGTLDNAESAELTELIERGDKLTLRKSQAMRFLAQRGHSISLSDLKPTDE
jgi:hypothetical protein